MSASILICRDTKLYLGLLYKLGRKWRVSSTTRCLIAVRYSSLTNKASIRSSRIPHYNARLFLLHASSCGCPSFSNSLALLGYEVSCSVLLILTCRRHLILLPLSASSVLYRPISTPLVGIDPSLYPAIPHFFISFMKISVTRSSWRTTSRCVQHFLTSANSRVF